MSSETLIRGTRIVHRPRMQGEMASAFFSSLSAFCFFVSAFFSYTFPSAEIFNFGEYPRPENHRQKFLLKEGLGMATCPFFPHALLSLFRLTFPPPTTSTLNFWLRLSDEGTDPKLKTFSSWSLWRQKNRMGFYSGFVGKRVANVLKLEVGDVDVKVDNFE